MKNYFPILIFTIIALFSCEKDTPDPIAQQASELSLNIVTGVEMRDESGAAISKVGNPNIKKGETSVFPNPSTGEVNAFILNGFLEEVWILEASQNKDFANEDFADIFSSHEVSLDSISDKKIMDFGFPGQDIRGVNLNLDNLETGYYRIFYRTAADEILWDNLKIDKSTDPNERITNLIDEWN